MMQTDYTSPLLVVKYLISAFNLITRRVKADQAFDYSVRGFWQAVVANWVLGLPVATVYLLEKGTYHVALFVAISLVAILLYCLVVWHILVRISRTHRFTHFLVPYFWVGSLQIVLFGLITLITGITQTAELIVVQIVIMSIAIWVLIWLFRLARDQLQIKPLAAIGFVVARFAVELSIGLLAGMQAGVFVGG